MSSNSKLLRFGTFACTTSFGGVHSDVNSELLRGHVHPGRAGAAQLSPACAMRPVVWGGSEGALGLCKPIAKRCGRARAARAGHGSAGAPPRPLLPARLGKSGRPCTRALAHARSHRHRAPSASPRGRCAHMHIHAAIVRGRRNLRVALEISNNHRVGQARWQRGIIRV